MKNEFFEFKSIVIVLITLLYIFIQAFFASHGGVGGMELESLFIMEPLNLFLFLVYIFAFYKLRNNSKESVYFFAFCTLLAYFLGPLSTQVTQLIPTNHFSDANTLEIWLVGGYFLLPLTFFIVKLLQYLIELLPQIKNYRRISKVPLLILPVLIFVTVNNTVNHSIATKKYIELEEKKQFALKNIIFTEITPLTLDVKPGDKIEFKSKIKNNSGQVVNLRTSWDYNGNSRFYDSRHYTVSDEFETTFSKLNPGEEKEGTFFTFKIAENAPTGTYNFRYFVQYYDQEYLDFYVRWITFNVK